MKWFWPTVVGLSAALLLIPRRAFGMLGGSMPKLSLSNLSGNALQRAMQLQPIISAAASRYGIDEQIIGGIISRESNYGLALNANGTSADGNDFGLMQINKYAWSDWINNNDWRDSETIIYKGAEILSSYLKLMRGGPYRARQLVAYRADGRPGNATRLGVAPGVYADPRPLYGDAALQAALAAYNTGPENVLDSLAAGRDVDALTAGGDYSAGVLSRSVWYVQSVIGASDVA